MLETISYTKLIKDSEIIPEDDGPGKPKITIKFPDYFTDLDIRDQTRIIRIIKEASETGTLDYDIFITLRNLTYSIV